MYELKYRCCYAIFRSTLIIIILAFFAASCGTTKYVPEGEHLLASKRLKVEGKGLKYDDFDPLIRQQPNRTVLWAMPLYLWFYNASSDKDNWYNRWLRSIGEPPVILDSVLTVATAQRMQQYAGSKGYYGTVVSDTIKYRRYNKRKANVDYVVHLAEPYRIRSISYDFRDTSIDTSFIVDKAKRLIRVGNIFDSDVLKAESERIAMEMRNRGYYYFYDGYVRYAADTTVGNRGVALTLVVHPNQPLPGSMSAHHPRFYVKDMVVNPEYNPAKALENPEYATVGWDTIHTQDFAMACQDCIGKGQKPSLRPKVIAISNAMQVGELYNERDVNRTYGNLTNLRLFRSVSINFNELPVDSTQSDTMPRPLRGSVVLTPFLKQSYTWGGEVSISGNGLFGASLTGSYQHKNLFRGAEILDASLTASFQKVQLYTDSKLDNSYELGGSVSLNIPRFLVPVRLKFYQNVYSPRTQIAVSGDFQQRPDYTRALGAFSFGYSWRNLGAMTYIFNPVDVNIINILKLTDTFKSNIKDNPYMLSAYQNAFLLGSTFSTIYSTRAINRRKHHYLRFDLELKGNLLWLGYQAFNAKPVAIDTAGRETFEVWGTQFAQFAKFDATYVYTKNVNSYSAVAFRALGGIGYAYGNSSTLPFDKMYYSGGANSMRGWQIRTLGPGAYAGAFSGDSISLLNHLSDMRLEMNFEYRFKLFWKLESAIFVDAGNIWTINNEDTRKGALITLKDFPKQIALNWGLGLRLNFNVLIVRVDYGMRLHDPAKSGAYFISPKRWFSNGTNSLFLALGYPF